MTLPALSSSVTGCVDSTFHFIRLSSFIQNALITFANANEEQQQMGSKVQVMPLTFSNPEFPENDLQSFPLQPSPNSRLFGLDILTLKPLWQGVRSLNVAGLPLPGDPTRLICTCLSRPYLPTWLSLRFSFPGWTDCMWNVKSRSAPTPTPVERPDFKSSHHTKALLFSKIPLSVVLGSSAVRYSL